MDKTIWQAFRDSTKSVENIREKESIKGKVEEIIKRILEAARNTIPREKVGENNNHFGMKSYLH